MLSFYDEKIPLEQDDLSRTSHAHTKQSSISSHSSFASLSSEKYSESYCPRSTTNLFSSSFGDKPLPQLPMIERRVRFVVEKPLPPLPDEAVQLSETSRQWELRRLEMKKEEWAAFLG